MAILRPFRSLKTSRLQLQILTAKANSQSSAFSAISTLRTIVRTLSTAHHTRLPLYAKRAAWKIVVLRYFNPIGAHSSGLIGENPRGIPNNLMPFIAQVASGKREYLSIFGNDYATIDGTGVRDYIHVVDLAQGHIAALEKLNRIESGAKSHLIYNLGTGNGYSVLQVLRGMEKAVGREIPFKIVGRRAGDVTQCYADTSKARDELGWTAKLTLEQMCADSWNWQKNADNFQ
jgi:UDP-glucose 4-epimerase